MNYICDICGYSTEAVDDIKQHMKRIHKTKPQLLGMLIQGEAAANLGYPERIVLVKFNDEKDQKL